MNVQEVPLNKSYKVMVDDEDYERVAQWRWCALVRRGIACYAYRSTHKKAILMHRFILDAPPGVPVDHIDGNGFNNRRANLRLCVLRDSVALPHSHNQAHRLSLNKNNTSGYRGVSWDADKRRWAANTHLNGRKIALGRYDDPVDAARAYDRWMREHHGAFAVLNFPGEAAV